MEINFERIDSYKLMKVINRANAQIIFYHQKWQDLTLDFLISDCDEINKIIEKAIKSNGKSLKEDILNIIEVVGYCGYLGACLSYSEPLYIDC